MNSEQILKYLKQISDEIKKPIPNGIVSLLNLKLKSEVSEDEIDYINEKYLIPNSKTIEENF